MSIRAVAAGILLIICSPFLKAQVSYGGFPNAGEDDISSLETIVLDKPVISEVKSISGATAEQKNCPYIYAYAIDTELEPSNSGTLLDRGDSKIWLLKIRSKGAYNISLLFDEYRLAPGAEIFVYNENKNYILGSFSSKNNNSSGILAIQPVPGDELLVEAWFPGDTYRNSSLKLGKIGYGIKNIINFSSPPEEDYFGTSGDCNVDVNCWQGEEWLTAIRSVVRLSIFYKDYGQNGAWGLCTGVLVNNTGKDSIPYFITANHCVDDTSQANSVVAVFNYESPQCDPSANGSVSQSLSSSVLRATNPNIDFALIEMREKIPLSYNPYFAGWDISGDFPSHTASIHHPQGDVKKISMDMDPPKIGSFLGYDYDDNVFWNILEWDAGVTEMGSSGAPLFDPNAVLIGTLAGGSASCSYPYDDYYQKLYDSWDNYSADSLQLKIWLDPAGTGQTKLEGIDVISGVRNHKLNQDDIYKLWPNPSNGVLFVESTKNSTSDIEAELYSVSGKLLFRRVLNGGRNELNLSAFRNGIYLLRLKQADIISIKKISLLR